MAYAITLALLVALTIVIGALGVGWAYAIVLGLVLALVAWMVLTAGWAFAAKRMAQMVLIVVVVSFATTALLRQVPGDPCVTALQTAATPEAVAECREDRKLDENLLVQYRAWVGDVVSNDLGLANYRRGDTVADVISQRGPRTAWLFLYSQTIALAIAIPLGVWAAYQAGRPPRKIPRWILPVVVAALVLLAVVGGWSLAALLFVALAIPIFVFNGIRGGPGADNVVNAGAFVLLSIPVFVVGETLRYVFAIERDWYDIVGYAPWSDGAGAHIRSVWLPALVLGLAVCPVYLRLLRADMIQNLQQDFVAVAKAKGMSNRHILLRHVLRPSTVTLLTVVGLNIAQLVNGAVVVEFIYDLDGMGGYLVEATLRQDFFPVQTIVTLVAILFVLANTAVDVLYSAVDPRVSVEDEK